MAGKSKKAASTWSEMKAKLAGLDRAGLLGLIQDLYAASQDNRTFLQTRFGSGDNVLEPYKSVIDRFVSPDAYRNQDISVSKAKKAIADYKKASGKADGMAELMVFYCERAACFSREFGVQDENYFDALVRMFEQALKVSLTLATEQRDAMLQRLDDVSQVGLDLGYGVGEEMEALLTEHR